MNPAISDTVLSCFRQNRDRQAENPQPLFGQGLALVRSLQLSPVIHFSLPLACRRPRPVPWLALCSDAVLSQPQGYLLAMAWALLMRPCQTSILPGLTQVP